MSWFDAGVNLLDRRFERETVLTDSIQAGLRHLLIIASDIEESLAASDYIQAHKKTELASKIHLSQTAGVHPHYAKSMHCENAMQEAINQIEMLLAHSSIAAIGECGLDFNRNFSTPDDQIRAFDAQLQVARAHDKGVYLHERDAFDQQVKMLKPLAPHLPFMVAHCFTGNERQLNTYLDLGCYIGITGWVCDDKRGLALRGAIQSLPLNRLLIETDAPYLFPKNVRPRAKNNAPKYLMAIAEAIAKIKDVSLEEVQQASYLNACNLFIETCEAAT
ncbi:TatD family hydrolase [Ningiella sp. W23]|uniref:TatD family hydrolase n=1 Tax=Ningiella sp. W23 TaxID=3023715 RepID=UPI00375702AE